MEDKTYGEAAMLGFAKAVVMFYRELIKGGVPKSDAVALTMEWMRLVIGSAK
jgi:hypothetical protein